MKKRTLLATGSLVTTLLLTNPGATHAQSFPTPTSSEVDTTERDYDASTRPDMSDFGIQADDLTNEEQLVEVSQQTFLEEGFGAAQVHKIFSRAHALKKQSKAKRFVE